MGAAKVGHKLPGEPTSVVINGGLSAGAQNGSRVAKVPPVATPKLAYLPETAPIESPHGGDFHNKQDGNQVAEKGPQGKPVIAGELTERTAIALPPEVPYKLNGRPTVLTPERLEQLCQLLSLGFSRAQAAAYLGFDRSAVTRATQRDPELKAALQRAEEVSDLQPQLTVIAEARKNWRAAAWLLQFKARHQPRKQTDADKEELHQARLADLRREMEAIEVMGGKKS